MAVQSAKFIKGIVGTDELLEGNLSHIAFIGRSNVGKSSLISALTRKKNLARTSSFPGRTTEINVFLINKSVYFLDLPGYGFAKASLELRERLKRLIDWYLFESQYEQKKVILIIDAYVGLTDSDRDMLQRLEEHHKEIVIVANKIDKIRKSTYDEQLQKIQEMVGAHKVIPCSLKKGTGIGELNNSIFSRSTL